MRNIVLIRIAIYLLYGILFTQVTGAWERCFDADFAELINSEVLAGNSFTQHKLGRKKLYVGVI